MTSETNESPKLCVTCKHIATSPIGGWENFRCFAPQNYLGLNMVTGGKQYKIEFCKDHRTFSGDADNFCGREGKWWVFNPPKVQIVQVGSAPAKAASTRGISADDL